MLSVVLYAPCGHGRLTTFALYPFTPTTIFLHLPTLCTAQARVAIYKSPRGKCSVRSQRHEKLQETRPPGQHTATAFDDEGGYVRA